MSGVRGGGWGGGGGGLFRGRGGGKAKGTPDVNFLFECGGRWETGACDVLGVVDEGYLRKCLRCMGGGWEEEG